MKKLLLMLILLLLVGSVSATDWYVDNAVSVNGNGQSWSNAWKNLSSINWSVLQPGDTVYISGGSTEKVYDEQLNIMKSGSPNNRIKITKGVDEGHNGKVVIKQIRIWNQKHLEVSNLYVINDNASMVGVYVVGRVAGGVKDVIIKNNYINVASGGIHISGYNPYYYTDQVDDVHIINNTLIIDVVNNAQTDGLYTHYVQNLYIEDNYFNIYNNNTRHNDLIQTANHVTNITIARNILIHRSRRSAIVGNADNGLMMTGLDGVVNIHNNVIARPYDDGRLGIAVYVAGGYNSCGINATMPNGSLYCLMFTPLIYFYNNIVITDSSGNAVTIVATNRGVSERVDPNSKIKNNIFFCERCNSTVSISFLINPENINHNIYDVGSEWILNYNGGKTLEQLRVLGVEMNGSWTNVTFINKELFDYRLASNSRGIDEGVDLGINYNKALNNVSRPQGAAWDIGAFEYVSGSTQYHPADLNQNGCVELGEISVYVGLWLNNQGVSLSEASSAVSVWLSGCYL